MVHQNPNAEYTMETRSGYTMDSTVPCDVPVPDPKSPDENPMARLTGKGVYPWQFARSLLNPLRAIILSRNQLIRRLGLVPGLTVLELGPGPGYFSIAVARGIAPGTLLLMDIQPQMLAIASARLEAASCTNFETCTGDASRLPYPDASVDTTFMVTVLGEVTEREACLAEIYRVLRPGGLLSVSEMRGDPDYLREPEVHAMAGRAGFVRENIFKGLLHYTLNARKPGKPVAGN